MLTHLSILDLAIVQALSVDFDSGLTVLSGETGAGKSILLTALGLGLGDRADASYIRAGAQKAEVSLIFELEDSPVAREWLLSQDLLEEAQEACSIRRVIAQDGRSRAFVNGRPVTLQTLQELGPLLMEIHGQHAHVQLLKPIEQRRLLDLAGVDSSLVVKVREAFRVWKQSSDRLKLTRANANDLQSRRALLEFQVAEMEQLDLAALDYEGLIDEHERQANVGRVLEVGQQKLDDLYEREGQSVNARLGQAVQALRNIESMAPDLTEILQLLEEAQVSVKEAALLLRKSLDRLDPDPVRLEVLEKRMSEVHQIARKHQVRPEALASLFMDMRDELNQLDEGEGSLDQLEAQSQAALTAYNQAAEDLSNVRKTTAKDLSQRITRLIQELGMAQGSLCFEVRTEPDRGPGPDGSDSVEILVSVNPGHPPRPISKVASGGELSRISLAIQVAALEAKTVSTLIFDEVDTGVGGAVAEIVGQKLRLLGRDRQVFCVTHLPQVAVQGHQHFRVEKKVLEGLTLSTVVELTAAEREEEVARMLGGVKVTEQTRAHAREMLATACREDTAL
jgi:DNA repair protein RecN (Recombination protein N)